MVPGSSAVEAPQFVTGPLVPVRSRPRRRAVTLFCVLAPVLGFGAVELGALSAVHGAQDDARRLAAAHDWEGAVAGYTALAARGGPLYLLARADIDRATEDAERVELDWAQALAGEGQVDKALVLLDRVTATALVGSARRERAGIALEAARSEAAAGRYDVAIHRLDQLAAGHPPQDLGAQADALRPGYALGAGRVLLASGHPADAVAAFDEVVRDVGSTPEASEARRLLPAALLAAGRQALDAHDQTAALAFLERLTRDAPTTSEARTARELLAAPQTVTGTLVRRDGTPVSGLSVRLGSHYRRLAAGYVTSAPYYAARTDQRGDFTFTSIPVGGPYVLEVFSGGGWTTIVAQNDEPAYTVSITALTPVDLAFVVLPS